MIHSDAVGSSLAEAHERIKWLKRSFPRWCYTCYRIRIESGALIRFDLNEVQRAIHADKLRQLRRYGRSRQYVLKARQPGVTTYAQADNLNCIWSRRGRDAMTLTHALDETGKIFEITRRAMKAFPAALLPKKGAKDTHEVTFTERDSHFWTGTAGSKVSGRGGTLTQLHLSEFAFYADPREVLAGFSPSMEKVPESSVLIETTPSFFDCEAHQEWRRARDGRSEFKPLFFPWWKCDPLRYRLPLDEPDELGALTDIEEALLHRHGLDHEQIKWRRERIRLVYGESEPLFLREYPEDDESCWLTGGNLFYDIKTLRDLSQRAPTPIKKERSGTLEIFSDFDPMTDRVIIGADTAEGVGGDRSAFVARSFNSWKLLAVFQDSRIEPIAFSDEIAAAGWRYARNTQEPAFLVIEKNQHGITVLRRLRDNGYPLSAIYHRESVPDSAFYDASDRIGWQTSGPVYPIMLDAGREVLAFAKSGEGGYPSAAAINDALGIYRDSKGKTSLSGKDVFVSEILAWIGRRSPVRRRWEIL